MSKPFYKSKTIWVNTLTVIASVVLSASGGQVAISGEDIAAVVGVVNLVLRCVTRSGLST